MIPTKFCIAINPRGAGHGNSISFFSTSDDKVFLTTNCLIDFGFLLLKTKTPSRVAQQGALMLLTLCQTSSQGGTVQAVLDQLLRTLFQNPSKECADLLAKLPCGQLPASAGWDVISGWSSIGVLISDNRSIIFFRQPKYSRSFSPSVQKTSGS